MKDLSPDDRPREKLLRHGAAALGDNELVAVVLGSGRAKAGVLDVANDVLRARGGLHGLARSSCNDLARVAVPLGFRARSLFRPVRHIMHARRPFPHPSSDVDPAQIKRVCDDLRGVVRGELLFDEISRVLYASDASLFEALPAGAVVPRDVAGRAIAQQLIRCGTSIGANAEEAQGAHSRAEFARRMGIARSEARETLYWLKLIVASGLFDAARLRLVIPKPRRYSES